MIKKAKALIKYCDEVIADGGDRITLVLPKGVSSRIKGFPRGELLCENYDGSRVFAFDAKRVKAALLQALQETGQHPTA